MQPTKFFLLVIQFISYLWYFVWYLLLLPLFLLIFSLGLDWFIFKLLNFSYLEFSLGVELSAVKNLLALLLFLTGLSLVIAAWKALLVQSQSFPLTVIHHKKLNPQKLAQEGIYKWVRHPMLLGYFFWLESLGVYLLSPSLIFWLAPLATWILLELAVIFEEKSLARWFGQEYEQYRQTTPALIPRREDLKSLLRGQNPA